MYEFEQELMQARWERQDRLDHRFRIEMIFANKFVFVAFAVTFLALNTIGDVLPFRDWLSGHLSLGASLVFYVFTQSRV